MSSNMRRCPRCYGQKKMYKGVANSYSLVNFGGKLEDCPFCAGAGEVKTLESVASESVKKKKVGGLIKKEDENGVNPSV